MIHRIILLLSFSLFSSIPLSAKTTICLNMIVKNESAIICDCLASVKDYIDYWVIFDTGSDDGTQKVIQDYLKDIPGELHERPWVDFSHNRNEALTVAKEKADYTLFIDADEKLVTTAPFEIEHLDKDYYSVLVRRQGIDCPTILMINNQLDWKWKGILHEEVLCNQRMTYENLHHVLKVCEQEVGYRSRDPNKYLKDAHLLEKALETEPDNSRYVFYAAQSYFVICDYRSALKHYEKRVTMGGSKAEVNWSLYTIGLIHENLLSPFETVIESYNKAFLYNPVSLEPLYRLARCYLQHGNPLQAYVTLKYALSLPPTHQGSIYIEHWIYDYGF